jgi:hypothetical protein
MEENPAGELLLDRAARPMIARGRALSTPLILAVLAAAAAYETAVALEWISLGTQPGDGPAFEGLVLLAALAAMFIGALVSFALSTEGRCSTPVAPFGAAAGAFMVARFHGFDPYYLPTLRRYSDAGTFSPAWVYTVAGLGLLASLLCFARPKVGLVISGAVLFVCLFTSMFVGTGH